MITTNRRVSFVVLRKALLAILCVCPCALAMQAEDKPADPPTTTLPEVVRKSASNREALEKELAETLTGCVFRGHFQLTRKDGLEGKALLSQPMPETYTIEKAEKTGEDVWIISARVQYMNKDVTLPIPVRIVWAEDTPIISLTDLSIPLLGTYSARVMIFGKFYAGTWFGAGYGGVLSGQILRQEDVNKLPETPVPNRPPDVSPGE